MDAGRPIFVLGCPRSGTTLLQLMLHAHPGIAVPPETRFVLAAYTSRNDFGDLRDEPNRRALAQWIVRKETLFFDLGLDPQQTVEEIVAGPPTLGSALGTVFRAYARRFGKSRWGDKRPGYFGYIPSLLRLFPDAQIVHLIRDGRDCVASLKAMPWFQQDIYAAVATWMDAIASGRRAARQLRAGAYFELRYERLTAEPARELVALCEFLREDYDPAMTEPSRVAGMTLPKRQIENWHAGTHGLVTTARTGSWRERLDPSEISLCETVMGSRLQALGYELSGASRPQAVQLARFARVAARRRGAAYKRAIRDRAERARERGPVKSLP